MQSPSYVFQTTTPSHLKCASTFLSSQIQVGSEQVREQIRIRLESIPDKLCESKSNLFPRFVSALLPRLNPNPIQFTDQIIVLRANQLNRPYNMSCYCRSCWGCCWWCRIPCTSSNQLRPNSLSSNFSAALLLVLAMFAISSLLIHVFMSASDNSATNPPATVNIV